MSKMLAPAAAARTRARPAVLHPRVLYKVLVYGLLVIGAIVFLLPFLWMVSTSLKVSSEVFTYPPSFLPSSFQWRNYLDGWTATVQHIPHELADHHLHQRGG